MENNYWPKKITIVDVLINSVWTFISWMIWSIAIVILVFAISNIMSLDSVDLTQNSNLWNNNPLLPFTLSFITYLVSIITSMINYNFLNLTDWNKYKKSSLHFYNVLLFTTIVYIIFVWVYMFFWLQSYDNLIYVFILHIIVINFWEIILLEILNNYKYILLGFYWSIVWVVITWFSTYLIFNLFNDWYAKLISLLIIMPLVSFSIVFFKWIFELLYYKYFKLTWNDNLWDIFKQIKDEETQNYKKRFIESQNNN